MQPCGLRTKADLDSPRRTLRAALETSAPDRIKPVLQALIDSIRVESRQNIEPTFRIPAVRVDSGYMEPTRLNANHCARLPGGQMSLNEAE